MVAAAYSNFDKDEIKSRIDIVDFIQSSGVELKRAGRIYKACCPFHQDKTPSFSVDPQKGTWYCFGACAEGGDIFSFVMKRENLDFRSALELLAAHVGVVGNVFTPRPIRKPAPIVELRVGPSDAWQADAEAFHAATVAPLWENAERLGYTVRRIDPRGEHPIEEVHALIRRSELGYNSKEDTIYLGGQRYNTKKGIVAVYRDAQGRAVALQMRTDEPDEEGKSYKFLPGSKPTAHPFIADGGVIDPTRPVIIVESWIKALAVKLKYPDYNVIGLGSASYWRLAPDVLKNVRACPAVYLMLDNDPKPDGRVPGQDNQAKLAPYIGGSNVWLCVIPFGKGKDPDGFIAEGGNLADLLAAATAYVPQPETTPTSTDCNWPEHLPRQVERAILSEMSASVAVILRATLLARKQGFMTESFTFAELVEELHKLGITERAVRQGLEEDDGVFFARPDELKRNWRVSIIESDSVSSFTEPLTRQFRKKGRPAAEYRLRPHGEAIDQLIERVFIPHLTERVFKDTGVSPVDDPLLDAMGATDEETRQAIRESLADLLTDSDHAKAARVSGQIARVVKSLRSLRDNGEPLAGDWTTGKKYREAVIRREIVRANGAPLAQATLAARTGISERTIQRFYQTQAETERNWRPVLVRPEDVPLKVAACAGMPYSVVSVSADVTLPDAPIRVDADGTPLLVKGGAPVHITTPDGEIPALRRLRANEDTAAHEAANDRRIYLLTPAASSVRILDDDEREARRLELDAKRRGAEARRAEALAHAAQGDASVQAARAEALAEAELEGAAEQVELLSKPWRGSETSVEHTPPQKRYVLPGYNPAYVEVWVYRALARVMAGWGDGSGIREQFGIQMDAAIEILAGRQAVPTTSQNLEPWQHSHRANNAERTAPGRGRAEYLSTLTASQASAVLAWEDAPIVEPAPAVTYEWTAEDLAALSDEPPAVKTAAEVNARWHELRRTAAHPFNALREDAATLPPAILRELGSAYGWSNVVESVSYSVAA